jgi:hypothetical protein
MPGGEGGRGLELGLKALTSGRDTLVHERRFLNDEQKSK